MQIEPQGMSTTNTEPLACRLAPSLDYHFQNISSGSYPFFSGTLKKIDAIGGLRLLEDL